MKLPSKKVLSIFVVTAALVVSIIIAFGREKSSSAINFTSDLVAGEKVSMPENSNWEKELSGINSKSAKISTTTDETATDVVSRTFMANYLALKQNDALDSTSAQELINGTLAYVNKNVSNQNSVTIKTVADSSQSAREYGEKLGNILKADTPAKETNEAEIIKNMINNADSSQAAELDKSIAVYKKIAGDLEKIPVPKSFVNMHAGLILELKNMAADLEKIKVVLSDPIGGITNIISYQKSALAVINFRNSIIEAIKKYGISYEQGSGGYYLLYGI